MRRIIAAALSTFAVTVVALSPGRADGPTFAEWVRVGSGATEPGVNIADDGTVFVDGPAGLGAHSHLWKLGPGAEGFQAVRFSTPLNRLPGGGDSDVVIRGERVYYLDLWVGSNSLSISEDLGETWTLGTPFTSLPLSDRQWLALGRKAPETGMDTVYVLYALIQEPRQVMIARSRTGGLTWEGHFVAPALTGARGFTSQLESDGDRFLAFTWEDGGVLRAARSSDEGETWETSIVAENVLSIIPGVALDGEDMYAAWLDRGDWTVRFSASHDKGATWSAPVRISVPETSNMFPWIDARNGKVAIAWYAADVEPTDPNVVPDTTEWKTRYVESLDKGTTWSAPVTVGPGKTGKICTMGLGCGVSGSTNRELGDFMTVTIGPDQTSHVVFGGRTDVGVKYARQIAS